jgi:hypothetical protein
MEATTVPKLFKEFKVIVKREVWHPGTGNVSCGAADINA